MAPLHSLHGGHLSAQSVGRRHHGPRRVCEQSRLRLFRSLYADDAIHHRLHAVMVMNATKSHVDSISARTCASSNLQRFAVYWFILAEKSRVRTGGPVRQSLHGAKDVATIVAAASSSARGDERGVPAFANGAVIGGKYLIEETVAEGGIGVVVVATHLALQQRVAIKYLKPKALSNPVIVERFVREARLAAQITSEHVVRVHDVGTLPDAGPYMVMEYLIGEDLGRTVQSGPLPIDCAVDYVLQACDALAEAHALRIVHRDIKPENMFLAQRASNTPIVKIIDFGISKIARRRGEVDPWRTETAASEQFGTPVYMSPEQLRSTSNVDARTDIWSLGIVLHELLTGSIPFEGESLPQVCTSILTARPARLTASRPSAPSALEQIVLKCLDKNPSLRYRNVAEFAQALAPFGPASASGRVARIVEVVRRGGDSIRAPAGSFRTDRRRASSEPPRVTADFRAMPKHLGTGQRAAYASAVGLAFAGLGIALAVHRASATAISTAATIASVTTTAPSATGAAAKDKVAQRASSHTAGVDAQDVESTPLTTTSTPATGIQGKSEVPRARSAATLASPFKSTQPSTPNSRRALFGERE